MRLLRFIPIQLTLALLVGILFGNYFHFSNLYPLVFTLLFLLLLGILLFTNSGEKASLFAVVAAIISFGIGLLSITMAHPENTKNHYTDFSFSGDHAYQVKITDVLKPTSYSTRYLANIKRSDSQNVQGRILLNLELDSINSVPQIDDELVIYGSLNTVKGPLNPYQFNYKAYLEGLGTANQLNGDATNYVILANTKSTLYGRATEIRGHIISKLKRANFGEAELSIIQALLLGQRNDISEETYTSYKNAGAVHILALSGLHIGILLLLLQWVLKPVELLPYGSKIKLALIVLLLWGFALIAGFSASIVRAVSMFSFVAYAMYLNRPSNTFNILALSMFFILLAIDPRLLFQVGFQMSYAAVIAIVWIYPLLQRLWYPKNSIVKKAWQLLSVSVAAQLGVLPISLFYFHQFPGLFFISNLLIVPALGIILGLGIIVLILAICNFLPEILVSFYNNLINWMNTVIDWVATQEAFIFRNISFDWLQLILAYGILFTTMIFFNKPNFKNAIVAAVVIISFQSYTFFATYDTSQKEALLVMHQTANSILVHQSGSELDVFSSDSTRIHRIIQDYQIGERIKNVLYKKLENSYRWKSKQLTIIDSIGMYSKLNLPIHYLLLTQSPKVNLERLIDSLQPKEIIADGSNYKSYAEKWQETCTKRNIPFHYTANTGAFYFDEE